MEQQQNVAERDLSALQSAELQRRLTALEAENEALRSKMDFAPPRAKRRSRGWALLSTVLVLIGVLLAPVAIIAVWAQAELTERDRFVATFAPLADDPAVQTYVTDQAVAVVNENIDVPTLTSDLVDGITSLGTGPRATAALDALKGPAAAGIQSLIESRIAAFVQSDAFADVWATALGVTHTQLTAVITNDPDSAITVGGGGEIGIQLGPIIDAVKTALLNQGIDFASNIPSVDRTIVVAQSDSLPTIQLAYQLAVAAGIWLPWIAIAFLAAGVLVARRKSVALIVTALALALMMVLTAILFVVGHALFIGSVSPEMVPSGVSNALFEQVVEGMRSTAAAVLTLAVVVAIVAWFSGPFEPARKLRSLARSGADGVRGFAEQRNVTTGAVGTWVYNQRVLLRSAVAVIASLVLVLNRPISPALIFWTLAGAVAAIVVIELVQRPPAAAATATAATATAATAASATTTAAGTPAGVGG
ncbi:hypothetical protein B0I08_107141 [Glaciihabitans tibetensis]|uniref:Integral membrane protein n=1 Tax=Glaciihabitans tibetensis TaxID=1266600 RepID=A0A2T0VAL7_9MICO|nr:hypothetical protein [Glaciihabitans tibetensis]PRY67245.1 hypothetical protein B0I08_107141 [Glaciihabitans tibetensis]